METSLKFIGTECTFNALLFCASSPDGIEKDVQNVGSSWDAKDARKLTFGGSSAGSKTVAARSSLARAISAGLAGLFPNGLTMLFMYSLVKLLRRSRIGEQVVAICT